LPILAYPICIWRPRWLSVIWYLAEIFGTEN